MRPRRLHTRPFPLPAHQHGWLGDGQRYLGAALRGDGNLRAPLDVKGERGRLRERLNTQLEPQKFPTGPVSVQGRCAVAAQVKQAHQRAVRRFGKGLEVYKPLGEGKGVRERAPPFEGAKVRRQGLNAALPQKPPLVRQPLGELREVVVVKTFQKLPV